MSNTLKVRRLTPTSNLTVHGKCITIRKVKTSEICKKGVLPVYRKYTSQESIRSLQLREPNIIQKYLYKGRHSPELSEIRKKDIKSLIQTLKDEYAGIPMSRQYKVTSDGEIIINPFLLQEKRREIEQTIKIMQLCNKTINCILKDKPVQKVGYRAVITH